MSTDVTLSRWTYRGSRALCKRVRLNPTAMLRTAPLLCLAILAVAAALPLARWALCDLDPATGPAAADCDAATGTGDDDHGPVCAVDASGMPRTFPDSCLVPVHNCLHYTNFAVVRKGEC